MLHLCNRGLQQQILLRWCWIYTKINFTFISVRQNYRRGVCVSHTKITGSCLQQGRSNGRISFTVAKFKFMLFTSSSDIPFIKEQCWKHTCTFQSEHCKLGTEVKRFWEHCNALGAILKCKFPLANGLTQVILCSHKCLLDTSRTELSCLFIYF